MSLPTVLFRPQYISDTCYLSELMYWLAFNRIPKHFFNHSWRTDPKIRTGIKAPMPGGEIVTNEEAYDAKIAFDPENDWSLSKDGSTQNNLDILLAEKQYLEKNNPRKSVSLLKISNAKIHCLKEHLENKQRWKSGVGDYLQIFKDDILEQIKSGRIAAYGTKLSKQELNILRESPKKIINELNDRKLTKVQARFWNNNKKIEWLDSSLISRESSSYIWVHSDSNEFLEANSGLFTSEKEYRETGHQNLVHQQNAKKLHKDLLFKSTKEKRGRPGYPYKEELYKEINRQYNENITHNSLAEAYRSMKEWYDSKFDKDIDIQNIKKAFQAIRSEREKILENNKLER